jgi:hypothetical protein
MEDADLDSAIDVLETYEARENAGSAEKTIGGRVRIGTVEDFFDRIGVVAISLNEDLKVGDIIEIGDQEEAVRQKVSSMQINHVDVSAAHGGDSVGVRFKYRVSSGTGVYRVTSSPG